MSQQGEAAEQIVNMATNVTVKGVEFLTNTAGKGALSLATFLIAALKDEKRTSGKARMRAFNGKPTKVFAIKSKDLKLFAEEAKKYGILYAAVINKKQPDGIVDVVVNANDAAKVNRITERFALSAVEVEKIRADIIKAREDKVKQDAQKERTTPPAEKAAHTVDENTLDHMMGNPTPQKTEHKQPVEVSENPTRARTEKASPSAPSSDTRENTEEAKAERPSVRQKIQELKAERAERTAEKQPQREKMRQTQHQQPNRTKRKGKTKER